MERASAADLLHGPIKHNAIATSTLLVVCGDDGKYRLVFQKRSANTAAHAGLFHVIPAAMFQPAIRFPKPLPNCDSAPLEEAAPEWDWRFNVIREYGEELFSEELDATQIDSRTPRTLAMATALADGRASLHATGLVVNLLNLRPEICTVLIIRDASWWKEQTKSLVPNWEYETGSAQPGQILKEFSLTNVEAEFLALCGASPGAWVPPGLAAVWLGVDAARREIHQSAI
jgi:hypothetical protein